MASGKAHNTASVLVSPIVGVALLLTTRDPIGALMGAVGCVAGTLISPDLDQQVVVHSAQRTLITHVPVLGWWWLGLWDPYARAFPHRHALTHFPFIGTAGRVGYLWLWKWALESFITITSPVVTPTQQMCFVTGLIISDIIHWVMDGCPIKWGKTNWQWTQLSRVFASG